MLDCEDDQKDKNSNCKHCQAGGESESEQQQRYWDIPLDQDLLETIVSIYPEWFKDCNMSSATSPSDRTSDNNPMCPRLSSAPPPTIKQEDGEVRSLDENKESLKVKLMLRRPQVDQGILTSLKSPPAFHEQKQKLEKPKVGDILKYKLQKRPERQESSQQHILEEPGVDSNLEEKQKQLKKVRLAETLNKLVSQRPASADLQHQRSVFPADEILAQSVRDSALPFYDVPSPKVKTILDEDSESEVAFPPSPIYDFSEHSQSSLPSVEASEPSPNPLHIGSPCSGRTSFSMSPSSSVSSPVSAAVFHSVVSPAQDQIAEYLAHHMQQQQQQNHCDTGGTRESTTNKNRKKTKPKTQPKARTIKFHEYRGPPNAPKNSTTTSSTPLTESHSDLWLQQQQLFLRLQQECLQTHTQVQNGQVITSQMPTGDQIGQLVQKPTTEKKPQLVFESPNSPQKLLSNFEDLKVTDLRAELKKKGLPVSGSKPTLIKRLRSHLPSVSTTLSSTISQTSPPATATIVSNLTPSHATISVDTLLDGLQPTIPISTSDSTLEVTPDTLKGILNSIEDGDSIPTALVPMDRETLEIQEISDASSTSLSNEDIVQLQQIWIEKLQKDLERSRKQLQQCQLPIDSSPVTNTKPVNQTQALKTSSAPVSKNNFSKTEAPLPLDHKIAQRQIIHQFLQQKIQQQELQKAQRQQVSISSPQSTTTSTSGNSTLTALLKSSPLNATDLDIDLSSVDMQVDSATKSVASFPSSIMSTQVQESKIGVQTAKNDFPTISVQMDNTTIDTTNAHDNFPGVIPIFMCHTNAEEGLPVVSSTPALSNRSSSLPSFSALLSKAPPTRSNTDPQFQLTRPPPNYNEATRQLKVKQLHHLAPDRNDGNPQQTKKHKTSVKCQAVDDVLEILIKNGELSPSAAQEPTTPVSSNEQASLNLFRHTNEPFFSKTPLLSSSSAKDVTNSASDLQLAQSLMDLTPPSSTGFAETGCPPSLDFDFPLDMTDIDAMELDGMDNGHVHGHPDPTLSITMAQDVKPPSLDFVLSKSAELANHLMKLSETNDVQDRGSNRGLDNDIIELLGDFEDPSSTSNNFRYSSTFGMTHDSDPLFSNGYDTLDFFSSDDMDFKPQHEMNFLPWSENAT